jgi:type IV secretory pathway TrbD component
MRGTAMSYYGALNRSLLIMGVERRLFFLIMALSSSVSFTALFQPLMIALSCIIFGLGLLVGRFLTRSDAQFFSVTQRHLRYQKYYEPIATVGSLIVRPERSVPAFKNKGGSR